MKQLKKIAGLLAGISLIATSAHTQTANVNGNITGLKATSMIVYYKTSGGAKTDTVTIKDGRFKWTPALSAPQKVNLFFLREHLTVYVENSSITIRGTAEALNKAKISGSVIQDEATAYFASIKSITDQENKLYEAYSKADKAGRGALDLKFIELLTEKKEKEAAYITRNPKSFFSLSLVTDRVFMGDYEDVKNVYDRLDVSKQQTEEGKLVAERLALLKRSAIGAAVPDFTQNNTEGKPVHFSDFKGKYVLIDFWASWCGPCRGENPNVLKAYNNYKAHNFTVVGISLDDKENLWKKAIADDGMPWTQLSDLAGFQNQLATYYGIQGIPSTLLVGPDGKIIAKDLRGEMLNIKLAELFN